MVFLMKTILFFLFLFLRRFFSFHKEKKAAKEKSLPQEALSFVLSYAFFAARAVSTRALKAVMSVIARSARTFRLTSTPASLRPLMRLE